MFSAGCVFLSSSRTLNPNWPMAGWVEHSSAMSIALPWRAWAIGAEHASSALRLAGG